MEYILAGVLILVIIASVVVALSPMQCDSGPSGPAGQSKVKCVECGEIWEIDPKEEGEFNRAMEMAMGGAPVGKDCEKCGKKECVFMMSRCPKCEKYYLSKRITDPDAWAEGGYKEICPLCGTDVGKWQKEHRRR